MAVSSGISLAFSFQQFHKSHNLLQIILIIFIDKLKLLILHHLDLILALSPLTISSPKRYALSTDTTGEIIAERYVKKSATSAMKVLGTYMMSPPLSTILSVKSPSSRAFCRLSTLNSGFSIPPLTSRILFFWPSCVIPPAREMASRAVIEISEAFQWSYGCLTSATVSELDLQKNCHKLSSTSLF